MSNGNQRSPHATQSAPQSSDNRAQAQGQGQDQQQWRPVPRRWSSNNKEPWREATATASAHRANMSPGGGAVLEEERVSYDRMARWLNEGQTETSWNVVGYVAEEATGGANGMGK